ncbi:chitin Hypothetical protein [Nesidiocoris tenuis]|uniref:Chitin-binding type-2 domain-containing protein n=1 Tax=Nesidiocoris tenuis TaxID=355587 RepID=A0ABN7ADM4_9HEMI|nr:chitin Hypothetical protein [Nesidiocoris tenuis]
MAPARGFQLTLLWLQLMWVDLTRGLNIKCPAQRDFIHGLPKTRCSQYYTCSGASIVQQTCPSGTHYSPQSRGCQVGGSCYDLVCAGRVDGSYADTVEGCKRWYECRGGDVFSVESCPADHLYSEQSNACLPASTTSCLDPKYAAGLVQKTSNPCDGLTDGYYAVRNTTIYVRCANQAEIETHFCPPGQRYDGRGCSELYYSEDFCSTKADGYHVEENTRCNEYVLCVNKFVALRSKCPAGTAFDGQSCMPQNTVACPHRNKCNNLPNGFYPNVENNCRTYYQCSDGMFVREESCPTGLLWDGRRCVPMGNFKCVETTTSSECYGRRGYFSDGVSKCKKYHYCNHGTKISFICPQGQVYNGVRCVPVKEFKCPEPSHNSCMGKASGYYLDTESNCRTYYYCANGFKITYSCPADELFDGKECVSAGAYKCPYVNTECTNRPDGYLRRQRSLNEYIYCSDGVKLLTLQCDANEVYDGEKCINVNQYTSTCNNIRYGHITDRSCRAYFFCNDGKVVSSGVCPEGTAFDGSSCGARTLAECDRGSLKSCAKAPDGFYADFNADCQRYFYCINGQKTHLSCPQGHVHNGDSCVPNHQFTCPTLSANLL